MYSDYHKKFRSSYKRIKIHIYTVDIEGLLVFIFRRVHNKIQLELISIVYF